LRELLRDAGCELVRQGKGSHEIWHSPITGRNFAVPIGIPSRHTANAILRQGLSKAFQTSEHSDAIGLRMGECPSLGPVAVLSFGLRRPPAALPIADLKDHHDYA
jgi:hypothetical protein